MRIASIIDISLVDVPGIPVTVIFTGGCNFDCPYCQNASLIPFSSGEEISPSDIVSKVTSFLTDGFCITGGEPTVHKDLPELLKILKTEVGGHINLNTQGSMPSALKDCLPFLDSVWFDLKTAPANYQKICRTKTDFWPKIYESMKLLISSDVAFWPRTTYVKNLINLQDIEEILRVLDSCGFEGDYVIQNYVQTSGVRETEAKHLERPSLDEIKDVYQNAPAGIRVKFDWR
ncbi:MAG: anaerobic ribonucleoside-triphosphate reductase activating protein [Candidatus Thorarchaeota archaeon]